MLSDKVSGVLVEVLKHMPGIKLTVLIFAAVSCVVLVIFLKRSYQS